MTTLDKSFKTLLCQEALQASGFYGGAIDNLWGPQTEKAYDDFLLTILAGKGTWKWFAEVDGNDIVVRGAWATAFGGDSDTGDSGETASGYPTKGHPELIACSLPMDGYGIKSLKGSPLPMMPFGLKSDGEVNPGGTFVIATASDGKQTPPMPVIDIGPSRSTGNALDLSVAAAKLFYPQATANNFKMRLDFRVIGGSKFT